MFKNQFNADRAANLFFMSARYQHLLNNEPKFRIFEKKIKISVN